ncbi:MAG TPA: glutaminyl-peptide cyclotransferase [Luteibaculaceae bacterium]|nr:glutaminyl-peptide cyclotransferase [Luteibaculaceae bacterium]
MTNIRLLAMAAVFWLSASCSNDPPAAEPTPETNTPTTPVISYVVVAKHPHDTTAFTEGLEFVGNRLIESTGSPENLPFSYSAIRYWDYKNGKADTQVTLDKSLYFGEGVTVFQNKVYQLTYRNQLGFIYDLNTFRKLGEFRYMNAEGWGFTHDSTNLIMSDGTGTLTFLDPTQLQRVKTLDVVENGYKINNINELEYVNGYIYANLWLTNAIVKIDANTGQIAGRLDLYALKNEVLQQHPAAEETNGIAYNPATQTFFVTGKMWPYVYEIKLDPKN